MKAFLFLASALLAFALGCDSGLDLEPEHEARAHIAGLFAAAGPDAAGLDAATTDIADGDSVRVVIGGSVYEQPDSSGAAAGIVAAGDVGVAIRVRSKNGVSWVQSTIAGITGFVQAYRLEKIAAGDPPPDDPPPDDPPPGGLEVRYGFIGCSNTYQKARGMRRLGWASAIWPVGVTEGEGTQVRGIGHGALGEWADPAARHYPYLWETLDYGFEQYPSTDTLLWEICLGRRSGQPDVPTPSALEVSWMQSIKARLDTDHPGVTLVVWPYPDYVTPCKLAGTYGPARAKVLADTASVLIGSTRGPDLPIVGPEDLGGDNCHLNEQGENEAAAAIIAFLESQ